MSTEPLRICWNIIPVLVGRSLYKHPDEVSATEILSWAKTRDGKRVFCGKEITRDQAQWIIEHRDWLQPFTDERHPCACGCTTFEGPSEKPFCCACKTEVPLEAAHR